LRFPTFIDDWCISTIGKNFKLSSGLTPSTKEKTFFNNGTIAWINSGELKDKYIKRTDNLLTKKAVEKHNLTVYPPNTMIIAIYGLEAAGVRGKASITKMNSTISQSCIAFEPIGVVSEQFMYYLYKKEAKILGTRYAQGTKQQNLSSDLLITYKIHYPTKLEQKNITNFLSKIDDRIDTQIKIIDKHLSLINAISSQLINKHKGNIRIQECLECYSSNLKETDLELIDSGKYNVYGANGCIKKINTYNISEPSITIVKDGAGVGRLMNLSGNYSVLSTMNYLIAKEGFDINYIYYALKLKSFKKYIVGSGIPHIYYKDYKQEKIYVPKDKENVKKITSLLILIDQVIKLESEKLKYLKDLKKYLLKNMFV